LFSITAAQTAILLNNSRKNCKLKNGETTRERIGKNLKMSFVKVRSVKVENGYWVLATLIRRGNPAIGEKLRM
jgi:hypothetical protein